MRFQNKKEGRVNSFPSINDITTTNGIYQRYEYIPLDGFRFEIIDKEKNDLFNNSNLSFNHHIKDGEILYSFCFYQGLYFKVYPSDRIILSGSFHKFYNNGEHNHNNLSEDAFKSVLMRFKQELGVHPHNLRLIQLEYGFNLYYNGSVSQVMNGLIQHRSKDFEQRIKSDKGNYKQVEHSDYILKVYDKGLQYGLRDEVLRIEIKVINWSRERKHGIVTLADFLGVNKRRFLGFLLSKWGEVIFFDFQGTHDNKWIKYSNPNYWRELRDTRAPKNVKKHVDRLRELNENNGVNTQEQISNLIIDKMNELQGVTNSKVCALTGVDISMQREDSYLLSHKGLYNLIKNNKEEFERLKRSLLSTNWYNSPIQTQVKEIAHNIRSKYNYRVKTIDENQLSIFAKG